MQTNKINLTGRVAVVTGGAQGIGLEVGRRLKAEYNVASIEHMTSCSICHR